MPDLQDACPVSYDKGSRSYALQTIGKIGMDQASSEHGESSIAMGSSGREFEHKSATVSRRH